MPEIVFPPELPITARVLDIAKAIDGAQVVIVAGATGSGKTTQLPKIALAMGRGVDKIIGVTQPRRIAATSTALRVATELGSVLGTDVGYQVRFDDRTSKSTYVKFMTDGILLAEIQGDPLLRRYDTLIVDEAHERSLTIDFLLGWLKRLLPRRPDLKVVVSSATLETERFSKFFDGAPVIQVEGRTYPVEVLYEPPVEDADLADAVGDAVATVTSLDPQGDILVFLPGEREIKETENELRARNFKHTQVQPLYARLSAADQAKVFTTIPGRRIILATNVAETSVTIPGIVYVIDTGVARLSRYDPRSGTTRLQVEAISQASADQRKGRCGRVREGICVRLYEEQSFQARPAFTDPEIIRTGLAGVILRMKSLGLGDVDDFPFLDPPSTRSVTEGYRVLEELGALGEKRELTALGRRLAAFPVDPRIGRMILAGADNGCLKDVLVVAAALSVQDPRERPSAHQQKADEMHRRFRDERSDFVAYLRLWEFVRTEEAKGKGALRRACTAGFLNWLRVREWVEVHRQLQQIVQEQGIKTSERESDHDSLHKALLSGLLSHVGMWHPEHRVYLGAKQTRFTLHPSSSLAKRPPPWVMAFELVETSQLFARTAAKVDPDWLEEVGAHLLKSSYGDPHWAEKPARVSVREHTTLFGLTVSKDRSVDYAGIAPAIARKMFLDHALVRGEYQTRGVFHEKNRAILAEVARLRDKARRSDMLADETALLAFFDQRVPEHVVNGKTFEDWRREEEKTNPHVLELSLADVLATETELRPEDYPETMTLHGARLPLAYRFDPSADDDGLSVTLPLALVPQLDPRELDAIVPGLHQEKIQALLHELPRAIRKDLPHPKDLAKTVAAKVKPASPRYLADLAQAVKDATGLDLGEEAFRVDAIAPYLRLNLKVVSEGKTLAQGRDGAAILERLGGAARAVWKEAPQAAAQEKKGLTSWSFGPLPESVTGAIGGTKVTSYPSLVDRGNGVDFVLAESAAKADAETRKGLRRLVMIAARQTLSAYEPRIPGAFTLSNGGPPSKGQHDAFRAAVMLRLVDDAFAIPTGPIPRSKDAFDNMVRTGAPSLARAFRSWTEVLATVRTEHELVLAMLRKLGTGPSGKLAAADVRAQLDELFAPALEQRTPLLRITNLPRYLKAAKARLERAVADPRKDADKLAPFTPVWAAFLAKRGSVKDVAAADEVRWAFEELRVAIFAPELKPAFSVSTAKLAMMTAALK